MFVLLPLSGVFYPIDALPAVLQPIALVLPTTHAFAALRGSSTASRLELGAGGDRRGGCVRDGRCSRSGTSCTC